jgi:hypothetical protein
MGAEFRRFSKLFDFTVHVIPFIPPHFHLIHPPQVLSEALL